ncbi:hypothetical protein [Aeromonas dhakensis]|uniref:hypothetical protein n=1 Tax=Aeromonas dhakensis TaxID=196024 RepID=UPI00197CC9E2|nr:hypothetical protein [Aeromonas dhakensis]MBW3732445.1 hypothetical protein [Aeromonas dhakensis]QSR57008.1 hypothetical protein GO601_17085 [Aeromonas dhakensis]
MAIHGWGTPVSIYEIAVELGIGATGLSLGDQRVRNLLGDSGAVYMSNAYGKSNTASLTIGYEEYTKFIKIRNWGFKAESGMGALSNGACSQGVCTALYIRRGGDSAPKLHMQTTNGSAAGVGVQIFCGGTVFNYTVPANGSIDIPNQMMDIWSSSVGVTIQIKLN